MLRGTLPTREIVTMTDGGYRIAVPGAISVDCPAVEAELLSTPWFTVRLRGGYYTIEPPQAFVLILPVVRGQGVVMVRVRRPLQRDCPLETPGGGMINGETAVEAARRELREETGIDVADLSRFSVLPPVCEDPSRFVRLAHVLRVDLEPEEFAGRAAHDHEIEEVQLMPFDDVRSACVDGRIYIIGTLAVLMRGLTPNDITTTP